MSNYKGTYDGQSLKHYRTKGSKNGYSKDPNYKPIGEIAKGPDFYARMAAQQRQAMSGVNNSIEAYRRSQLTNKAQASYNKAQARAMQARNKAHGTAYGQMKTYAAQQKANAIQKQNSINAAKGVAHNPISPQQEAEQRRIAGGRGVMVKDPELARKRAEENAIQARIAGGGSGRTAQSETTARMIKGSPMTKTPEQRQAEVMERRIKGGNYGSTARKGVGINSGYEAQAAVKAKQNQRSEYAKLERRRKYENMANGVTANKAAAEARRIAGSKLGSGYVDYGAGNFRRGVKLAGQAITERMNPNRKQRSMNKHYGEVINETVSKYHAKQAAKEIGTGIKKGVNYAVNEGKNLAKKGKKKVKKLMSKWFG